MTSNHSSFASVEDVILVIGSCCLDRLLTVSSYPSADEKIRSTAYHEGGGGNAANTAHTMALLANASFLNKVIRIKLLTKIGNDDVGRQLTEELQTAGVDLSSPLFITAGGDTTTPFTTVVVSELEHTRTCIHTPGTCGELVLKDLEDVTIDQILENVVHLHSDCRHTNLAFALAREARNRGIPVSVDAEKDRHIESMDGLLDLATLLFTNSTQLDTYFARRIGELNGTNIDELPEILPSFLEPKNIHLVCQKSVAPSRYFLQWYGQRAKEVVITKGSMGALHISCCATSATMSEPIPSVHDLPSETSGNTLIAVETITGKKRMYTIHSAGVLRKDINIVDPTGAGDAFIGAFILSRFASTTKDHIQFGLNFGSWVAGRKLGGTGARSALPRASAVDMCLGRTVEEMEATLSSSISGFGS